MPQPETVPQDHAAASQGKIFLGIQLGLMFWGGVLSAGAYMGPPGMQTSLIRGLVVQCFVVLFLLFWNNMLKRKSLQDRANA